MVVSAVAADAAVGADGGGNASPPPRASDEDAEQVGAVARDTAVDVSTTPQETATGATNSAAPTLRTPRRNPASPPTQPDAGATPTSDGSGSWSAEPCVSRNRVVVAAAAVVDGAIGADGGSAILDPPHTMGESVVVVRAAATDAAVGTAASRPVTAAGAANSAAPTPKTPRRTPATPSAELNTGATSTADGGGSRSTTSRASDDKVVVVAVAAVDVAGAAADSPPVTTAGRANSAAPPPKTLRRTLGAPPAELDAGAAPTVDGRGSTSPAPRERDGNVVLVAATAVDAAVAAADSGTVTRVGAANSVVLSPKTPRRTTTTPRDELDPGATPTADDSGSRSPASREGEKIVLMTAAAVVDDAFAAADSPPATPAGAMNSAAAPPKTPRHNPATPLAEPDAGATPTADGGGSTSSSPRARDNIVVAAAGAAFDAAVPAADLPHVMAAGAANSAAAPQKTPLPHPSNSPYRARHRRHTDGRWQLQHVLRAPRERR